MEGRKSAIGAWVLVGLLVVVLARALLLRKDDEDVTIATLLDPLTRGARLSTTTVNAQGFVDDPPYALLGEASEIMGYDVEEDTLALARSGRSEGRNGIEARMHVMLNQAHAAGRSLFDMTTREPGNPGDGYYGEQRGRRWASSRDPYAGDVRAAEKVRQNHAEGRDPTGGATNFYDVKSFGKQAGTGSEEAKRAEWQAKGLVAYYFPGASEDFVLWRPGSVPDGFDPAFT